MSVAVATERRDGKRQRRLNNKKTEGIDMAELGEMVKALGAEAYRKVLPALLVGLVPAVLVYLDVAVFKMNCNEAGIVEFTQSASLLAIATLLAVAAFRNPGLRGGLVLATGFFLTMFVRENDQWLDVIRHGCWIYPAIAVVLVSCALALRSWRTVLPALIHIMSNPHAALLSVGFSTTVLFSRVVGMKAIWRTAVGNDDYRVAKHVAEEGCELLGYAILLLWAISFFRELARARLEVDDNAQKNS